MDLTKFAFSYYNIHMEKKYFITTYGCQMNLHESEKIAGILSSRGYIAAQSEADADIIVFNTCCIRENAEDRAYGNIGALKKLKKQKPSLLIAVGGCMTQQSDAARKLHEKLPFVDIIFGTYNLESLGNLIDRRIEERAAVIEILDHEISDIDKGEQRRNSFPNAWVNIMYGCNNFCTYCIVPYVRGRERSRKQSEIVAECKELIAAGYKEITLLGQNVNSYGSDLGDGSDFSSLLREIGSIEGRFRLRFMTNHPKDFSEKLILAMKETPHVCKSIHLPVQAGSNRILKLMNRKYTREDYLEKIDLLHKYIPDCAVSTDIMVGFPTETEEDFLETLDLVEKARFSGAFMFVYSRRSGTKAAVMDGQISEEVSKDRIVRLIAKQNEMTRTLSKVYLGKTVEILCEGYDEKKQKYLGRDEYGRMGYFSCDHDPIGNFVTLKITRTGGISLYGEIVEEER